MLPSLDPPRAFPRQRNGTVRVQGVTHAEDHAEREEDTKGEHVDKDVGP